MRVLVAEDDDDLRPVIVIALRGASLTVDAVADIPAADEALAVTSYDCVVFDRMLPSGDAVNYLASQRRRGWSTPAMFLTARDSVDDRILGLEYADDYLGKPFAIAELVARVRNLCHRGDTRRPSVLRCGDLEMDLGRREVRRDGVLLSLTLKQYSVLEQLMINLEHTVSRTDLFEHCWDEHAAANSNALDVTIAMLRRKLGPPEMIRTLRGYGYRLVPAE
ncbi:winged helix-turn-helix domain-containing protein [Nocardia sp. NPDC004711]